MNKRNDRLDMLRLILSHREIGSQEELLAALAEEGYVVTQATLSRDLRKIKAVKVAGIDGYRYVLPEHPSYTRELSPTLRTPEFLRTSGFLDMEFSGNLVVMHTRPGYAAGITTEIDARRLDSIVGTIAGDDTILCIIREGYDRPQVVAELARVLPAIGR